MKIVQRFARSRRFGRSTLAALQSTPWTIAITLSIVHTLNASANTTLETFLRNLAADSKASNVFGEIRIDGLSIHCKAKDAAAEAWYSVVPNDDHTAWMVRLTTADRWLSESIESDLMHYGDPIEELIEEELIELGHDVARDGAMPRVKHFRSEAKLYTFENPIPVDTLLASAQASDITRAVTIASRFLHAYEAAFRQHGDMAGGDDE